MIPRGASQIIFAGCTLVLATAPSRGADVPPHIWDTWNKSTKQICPSHKLDLLGDVYDDLIGDFSKTLPRSIDAKVNSIAAYSRRCADEKMGFYCEMAVHVDAYEKLGLLKKFATFACSKYKCLEGAYCVDPKTGKFK